MPIVAISVALQAWERSRGVRQFALRRGNEVLQIVAHTPVGRFLPQPVLDDGADDEAARIATAARKATSTTATAPKATPKPAARPAEPAAQPKATQPNPVEPAPSLPSAAAVEMGAPGAVTDKVERIADRLDVPAPTSRDDLPIPDFDNVSLGSLRARLRSLSPEDLVTLREWEQAHANRLPVITLLDNRIAKVGATGTYPPDSATGAAATTGSGAAQQAKQAARDEGGTLRV